MLDISLYQLNVNEYTLALFASLSLWEMYYSGRYLIFWHKR